MKTILTLSVCLLGLLGTSSAMEISHKQTSFSVEKKATSKTFNKYCPVTGGIVNTSLPTVIYKGKKIGFCCAGCDKVFLGDPEKYLKNLSKNGQNWKSKKPQQKH